MQENYRVSNTGCWVWQGCVTSTGYSRMWDKVLKKADWGHRVFYRRYKGEIPTGLALDHLCKNTKCVNPEHLEPVTAIENVRRSESPSALNRRKTHCPKRHEYNATNSYFYKRRGGEQRICRLCQMEYNKNRRG